MSSTAAAARREPRGGALNEAAKAAGCTVRGVIHSMWIGEKGLDELIVEDGADLTERKRKLLDDTDVIVALPGGVGAKPMNYRVRARRAVHAARRAGKLQADEWTHDESVTTQAIVNAVRAAVIEGGA